MLGTILHSHVPEWSFVYPSFTRTRNHTQARYISLGPFFFFFSSCQNLFHVLIREKDRHTRDHRNFGLTGSVWFLFLCDLW